MFWVKSFSMGFGALGMNFSWKNDVFVSFLLFLAFNFIIAVCHRFIYIDVIFNVLIQWMLTSISREMFFFI